jgi:hypothetical protein
MNINITIIIIIIIGLINIINKTYKDKIIENKWNQSLIKSRRKIK